MTPGPQSAADVGAFIVGDSWRSEVLRAVQNLGLPDWAVGAGFIRNAVWDALHDRVAATPLADVDVLYFNAANLAPESDTVYEARLHDMLPGVPWSVKNQARMHLRNRDAPYRDTLDALRHWLETPAAVAIRIGSQSRVELLAPYGIDDLIAMVVRPTPSGQLKPDQYSDRVLAKCFVVRWPRVKVV